MLEEGQFAEAGETYWAEDVVSIEPMGDNPVSRGKEALRAKAAWWNEHHEVHGFDIEGPYVNGDQFALLMEIEVTVKATGMRMEMEEIALYTLRDGKIVEERFLYEAD
jgi:ketosteroid isomerase-like protein